MPPLADTLRSVAVRFVYCGLPDEVTLMNPTMLTRVIVSNGWYPIKPACTLPLTTTSSITTTPGLERIIEKGAAVASPSETLRSSNRAGP